MKKIPLFTVLFLASLTANAQALFEKGQYFSRADSLRGTLSPLRSCYDVTHYDLYVDVNPLTTFISGSNKITFKAVADIKKLQIDLSDKLAIDSIVWNKKAITYKREFNAVFVDFNEKIAKGATDNFTVYYHGTPIIAKNAPWDGGLVFSKDKNGKDFLGVACEGIGASTWWPCKDHLSDKPDSMAIAGPAPKGLTFVSNGRLRKTTTLPDGREVKHWAVTYPINSYNATFYIADFANFSDTYKSPTGKTLDLDYYVLSYNIDKAKKQFAEVKPMMECYEKYFGPYPFWRDGFKLVESPYLGMEHQSAVAYGNGYKTGYNGFDISGIGLKYDFIIIHEGGHEWWGNNVTMSDMADMWISEGFCTYAEVLYVECHYSPQKALDYINNKKKHVENDKPLLGHYGVNNEGSGDMYNKGALMIHTIRSVINDDKVFLSIMMGLQKDFGLKQVNTDSIVNYFNRKSGLDLMPVFNEYLRYTKLPVLQYSFKTKRNKMEICCKWKASGKDFNMPIDFLVAGKKVRINATTKDWSCTTIEVPDGTSPMAEPDTEHFYINSVVQINNN